MIGKSASESAFSQSYPDREPGQHAGKYNDDYQSRPRGRGRGRGDRGDRARGGRGRGDRKPRSPRPELDPNSVYRVYYRNNQDFHLSVMKQEQGPYSLKFKINQIDKDVTRDDYDADIQTTMANTYGAYRILVEEKNKPFDFIQVKFFIKDKDLAVQCFTDFDDKFSGRYYFPEKDTLQVFYTPREDVLNKYAEELFKTEGPELEKRLKEREEEKANKNFGFQRNTATRKTGSSSQLAGAPSDEQKDPSEYGLGGFGTGKRPTFGTAMKKNQGEESTRQVKMASTDTDPAKAARTVQQEPVRSFDYQVS